MCNASVRNTTNCYYHIDNNSTEEEQEYPFMYRHETTYLIVSCTVMKVERIPQTMKKWKRQKVKSYRINEIIVSTITLCTLISFIFDYTFNTLKEDLKRAIRAAEHKVVELCRSLLRHIEDYISEVGEQDNFLEVAHEITEMLLEGVCGVIHFL